MRVPLFWNVFYWKMKSKLHFRLDKDQKITINVSFPRQWMIMPWHTIPCWNERTAGPTVVAKEVGQVDVTIAGPMGTVATWMDEVHVLKKCQTFWRKVLFDGFLSFILTFLTLTFHITLIQMILICGILIFKMNFIL